MSVLAPCPGFGPSSWPSWISQNICAGNWLSKFGTAPELDNEPELPDAATLDAIAQAIKGFDLGFLGGAPARTYRR